jgi:hypothetical protein
MTTTLGHLAISINPIWEALRARIWLLIHEVPQSSRISDDKSAKAYTNIRVIMALPVMRSPSYSVYLGRFR